MILFVIAAALMNWSAIFRVQNIMNVSFRAKQTNRPTAAAIEMAPKKATIPRYNYTRPDTADQWPKVAWLMSFPNSGTSYTGTLVRRATLTVTASNYGYSNLDNHGNSTPLFEWSPIGPFITDPKIERNKMPRGESYILTKTHCGGTCFGCPPKHYLQTQEEFEADCLQSDYKEDSKKKKAIYDPSIVSKAVHLIRNPFDNVVSRFHLKRNQMKGRADEDWLSSYPNTKTGFQEFCSYVNNKFQSQEKDVIIGNSGRNLFVEYQNVPCVSDFIRYIQWHNHAVHTTNKMDIETVVLHYEDYGIDHKKTTNGLLDFLGLNITHHVEKFKVGRGGYIDRFEPDEIESVKSLVMELATEDTWILLKRYFV